MTGKPIQAAHRVLLLLLLCVLLLSLSGCAQRTCSETVLLAEDPYSPYDETLGALLPTHHVQTTAHLFVLHNLRQMAACEAFDVQAQSLAANGLETSWTPQFLATVVIAVDRERTAATIRGWQDLYEAKESVGTWEGFSQAQFTLCALAFGLEGEGYGLDRAAAYLADLRRSNRLKANTFDAPVLICYDFQAVALMREGRALEIVVPREGTFTFEKGLLSNEPLAFAQASEPLLLQAGFRLPDGRTEAAGYPAAEQYAPAQRVQDIDHFNRLVIKANTVMKRQVHQSHYYKVTNAAENNLVYALFLIVLVFWAASVVHRTVQKVPRKITVMVALLLSGWMLVRVVKWQIVGVTAISRYLWYMYYLFLLFLPLMLLWMAWVIDKTEEQARQKPFWLRAAFVTNGLLFLLVLANEFHEKVFRFVPGAVNKEANYSYDILFWPVTLAWVVPFLVSLVMLFYKSGRFPRKNHMWMPIVLTVCLFLYWYAYINNLPMAKQSDLTITIGLFSMLFFESTLRAGLIPYNTKYRRLFAHSPMRMTLYDADLEPVQHAAQPLNVDRTLLQTALAVSPKPALQDADTLIYASPIFGGVVAWQEDVSELNRLYKEVALSVQRLEVTNALLEEEQKLRSEREQDRTRQQLLLQLEAEISKQTERLSQMMETLPAQPHREQERVRIVVLLCYIKRRCHLFFREKEGPDMPTAHMVAYFEELASLAEYGGLQMNLSHRLDETVSVRKATLFYDFYYVVLDAAVSARTAHMPVVFQKEGRRLILRILLADHVALHTLDASLIDRLEAAGGVLEIKDLDGSTGVSLMFETGGDSRD